MLSRLVDACGHLRLSTFDEMCVYDFRCSVKCVCVASDIR